MIYGRRWLATEVWIRESEFLSLIRIQEMEEDYE